MIKILTQLFLRDLEKLKTEISSFKDEKKIWEISGNIKNSAGNLCLHLCGNLQHFIGTVLGNSGYIRNRDAEFSKKNVPIRELLAEIELTAEIVQKTLQSLKEEALQKTFPINVFGYEMTTEYFLIHLTTHLNYHLGQINYHRRLLDN
ncbi:MAG: DinB family protein [Ignavibacteriaceae bacterium]|nr:DinB family protein [Ignavibacteriaceae bacterium]